MVWLEFRSRWRRQQYSHFDTACQMPKGKLQFSIVFMMSTSHGCAPRYFRHLPVMSLKTTLHPLLYPCWRYPKCPWGLYASPPPVAMAVFGWFLCPHTFFGKKDFFPILNLRQKKSFDWKKMRLTAKKKVSYACFRNQATLSLDLMGGRPKTKKQCRKLGPMIAIVAVQI